MLKTASFIFTFFLLSNCFAQDEEKNYEYYVQQFNRLISEQKFNEAKYIAVEFKNYLANKYPSDPRIGIAYKGIAFSFNKLKQYDSSNYYYHEALNIFLDHFKAENYNTATTRCLIGDAYYQLKFYREAKRECIKANSIFQQIDSTHNYYAIENHYLLYKIYRDENDQNSAYQFLTKAIQTAEETYRDSFKDLPLFYKDLAVLYLDAENFGKAESVLNASLDLAKKKKRKLLFWQITFT